jgi:hypothetical protein
MNAYSHKQIRIWTYVLIIGLVLSGVTAINPDFFLHPIVQYFNKGQQSGFTNWLNDIYKAILVTKAQYPFLLYGYDWLAFAHILLGVLFIGVLKDPHHSKWLIQFGMIACASILPFAFVFGSIRSIPLLWTLIDCSFAFGAMVPLLIIYKHINILHQHQKPIK